jgi:hypothetical protein
MLGLERGHLIRQPLSRFIFKEDQDIYYLHRKELFEIQEPTACELRMVKNDETLFWTRFEGKLVHDKERGDQVCWSMVSDITQRIVAESALAKLHAKLEERVEDRTEKLQIMVDAMAGREVRMADLKQVITKLRKQLRNAGLDPIAHDPLLEPDEEW